MAIFFGTPDERIGHVLQILTLLNEADVKFNLEKCEFFTNGTAHLGRIIRPERLKVSTPTINAVRRFEHPISLTELRSFLEKCNVFQSFALNFAGIATCSMRSYGRVNFRHFTSSSDEDITALETLKAKLIEPKVLALPISQGENTVYSDTCDDQIDCILVEKQPDGPGRPILYCSNLWESNKRRRTAKVWQWYGPSSCSSPTLRDVDLPAVPTTMT